MVKIESTKNPAIPPLSSFSSQFNFHPPPHKMEQEHIDPEDIIPSPIQSPKASYTPPSPGELFLCPCKTEFDMYLVLLRESLPWKLPDKERKCHLYTLKSMVASYKITYGKFALHPETGWSSAIIIVLSLLHVYRRSIPDAEDLINATELLYEEGRRDVMKKKDSKTKRMFLERYERDDRVLLYNKEMTNRELQRQCQHMDGLY